MQDVAVDVVGAEMLERAGHRLRDLDRQRRARVVGQPVVLPGLVRELRLQEQILACDDAGAVGRGQSLTDAGLVIVPPLVRGVDAAEARPEGELGEGRRSLLLPGGAVQEIRNARRRH